MVDITYDVERGLIDFNTEGGEDHIAFTISELLCIVAACVEKRKQ